LFLIEASASGAALAPRLELAPAGRTENGRAAAIFGAAQDTAENRMKETG
jgi:hypothetical protein